MTLVTIMLQADMFFLEMIRHGNHLYRFLGTGPYDLIVASQAESPYFPALFFGKFCDDFAVLNMIGNRPMTELTGNGLVNSGKMHLLYIGMTGHA